MSSLTKWILRASRQGGLTRSTSKKVNLPSLQQGGFLSIKSAPSLIGTVNVRIVPQWREDASFSFFRQEHHDDDDDDDAEGDTWPMMASIELDENHRDISVVVKHDDEAPAQDVSLSQQRPTYELTAEVPERFGLNCHLQSRGSILISGKVEGSASLRTHCGNVCAKKLRGETVEVYAGGGGHLHAATSIEAQRVKIHTEGGRVRALVIHGSHVDINVASIQDGAQNNSHLNAKNKLDEDDALARIDVGSLYTSRHGDGAHLQVDDIHCPKRMKASAVRVKSNHGHVSVQAFIPHNITSNASKPPLQDEQHATESSTDDTKKHEEILPPVVELGGVNGSCHISINQTKPTTTDTSETSSTIPFKPMDAPAARIHFDSCAPNTLSIITCDTTADVDLTLDRKLQSDLRLLSCPLISHVNLDGLWSEDEGELRSSLENHTSSFSEETEDDCVVHSSTNTQKKIQILTTSFTETQLATDASKLPPCMEYRQGTVWNQSDEPDSRFDVATKGTKSTKIAAAGKINVQGAAAQALQGFSQGGLPPPSSGNPNEAMDEDGENPLIVVGTGGGIRVEKLSWVEAIARRYGLSGKE